MDSQIKLEEILEVCCDLAIRAGEEIMEVYNDQELFTQVEKKEDDSPLTMADKRANDVIITGLRQCYPNFAILSEEEKDDKSRRENPFCFIVDPLDGTKEFIKRNGEFTVNIALAQDQRVILGVVFVPATGDLYYAADRIGSFHKEKDREATVNVVSDVVGLDDVDKVRLVMSSSHGNPLMDELIERYGFKHFVKMGSSLKGCLIARGDAEIYYRHGLTCEWDTAAMQCIAEQAGATFRQMDGTEMLYNRENTLNEKGFYIINHVANTLM